MDTDVLPDWITWQQRPFPNANLLLVHGRESALVDSGFVGHAQDTVEWTRAMAGDITRVVNTHWHADHVGANGLFQEHGVGVAASQPEAEAVQRRDPGCCLAEYLGQPVAPYTVDEVLHDRQIIRLGDTDWQVIATPGHTAGHLSLWQPEERILVVGDALSDYDVGWINVALDGPEAASTAVASLQRLVELEPRIILPAHGPIPDDTEVAFTNAMRRAQRLVDDPQGAVWYAARRIFAYALMINDGVNAGRVDDYLLGKPWFRDAAKLLRADRWAFTGELVDAMVKSGAIVRRGRCFYASADYTPVDPEAMQVPFPRNWPA